LNDKAKKVLEYALAIASQNEDWKERELGRIHLVKYAYLADLDFAKKNDGDTFTKANWTFHHFGPWSNEIFLEIDKLRVLSNVVCRSYQWQHDETEGSGVAFRLSGNVEETQQQLEDELPYLIVSSVKRRVREFGRSTPELLHHVYITRPMLTAAPGDRLDFFNSESLKEKPPSAPTALTARRQKKKNLRLREYRNRIQEKLTVKRLGRKPPSVERLEPRYDDVFVDGVRWLDELGGEPIAEEGDLIFDDEYWKSKSRFDPDVS